MTSDNAQASAAIYLRISSDPTGQQLGVTRQRQDCEALCAAKGWTPVEYLDNDVSASSGKRRPAYERMLTDVRDGRIAAVVAWDLDRLHRRPIELESFMALADERHLALATVSGDIDLSTAQGRLTARLKGSVAAHEIEHKRARQLRAAQQKAERGEPQWRNAFGYLPDGSHTPDPATAPLVKRVYAHVLAGGSISDGARMLNTEGGLPASGNPWTASTLSLFLRKPRNAGLRAHSGEIIGQGTWAGLVDESTWRATQAVLNAPGRAPRPKSVRQHLLTGLLKCGNPANRHTGEPCDGYLSGSWVMLHPTGRKPGRRKAGEPLEPATGQMGHRIAYACKSCRGCSARAEFIEPIVKESVAQRLARADAIDLLKAEVHDAEQAEGIRQDLATLYGELELVGIERGQRLLTGPQAKIATDIIEADIAKLEARQQDQEMLRVFDGIPLGTPEAVEAVAELTPDRFRAVLRTLGTVTIMACGKGHRPADGQRFDRERVHVDFR
jgi:DNA invertase Pin-like site-specific DNA recombinase